MIISIGGTGGSGKSTIAKRLAKELGYKHYSMGDLQREIAKEKGVSIVELGEMEKKDPSIDRLLDDKQIKLGKEEDNFVIDGRLCAHFIPHSLKIFLDGDLEVRAKRLFQPRESETHASLEEAIAQTEAREKTNQERFLAFYGFDCLDHKNFDFVVDTTDLNQDEVFEKILEFVKTKSC